MSIFACIGFFFGGLAFGWCCCLYYKAWKLGRIVKGLENAIRSEPNNFTQAHDQIEKEINIQIGKYIKQIEMIRWQ